MRAGARGAQPRLHVMIAVAAGLERIDPHRLLARQSGRRGIAGIGALELGLAGRPLRRELKLLGGGLQQVGDDGNIFALATGRLRLLRRQWVDRPLRPDIDRRLRQHIIVERDGLVLAPLGVAAAPLLGDRIPVCTGFLLERLRAPQDIVSACDDIRQSLAARPPAPSRRRAPPATPQHRRPLAARSAAARARDIRSSGELHGGAWPRCSKRFAQVSPETARGFVRRATSTRRPAAPARQPWCRDRQAPRRTDRSAPPSGRG